MPENCFVGIDTSNYTTSLAVVSEDGQVIANLKLPLPVSDGARGLRQSDALFSHTRNLPQLMPDFGQALGDRRITAVGCSAFPRDAEGSYMPCFLAGKSAAYAMGAAGHIPVYEFSHQNGHLMAAAYSSGAVEMLLSGPFCAFHVSGGTTELVYVQPTESSFHVTLLGGTSDLNAGQAIDRTGVAMGLHFPCGKEMETLANQNSGKIPRPGVSVKGFTCNLSGLENLAGRLLADTGDRYLVSAFVFDYISRVLGQLTEHVRETYPDIPVLFAGGVMSNRTIQKYLKKYGNTYFAEPQFSADNAAGTALLCRKKYLTENLQNDK